MKKTLFLLAALSIFGFVSCKSNKISKEELHERYKYVGEWKIESLTGFSEPLPEASITIIPVDTVESTGNEIDTFELSVTGFSGVNRFFATIKGTGPDQFPIGSNMGSTKMMGSPEEMAFEDTLLFLLATADSWQSDKSIGKLTISNGTTTAVYKQQYADK